MAAYLLDTHVVLWAALEPERLTKRSMTILSKPEHLLFMSAASVWEIAIKHEKGLLELNSSCQKFVERCLENLKLSVLPLQWPECIKAAGLPKHHQDPFDRMIIQQAKDRNIPVITADALFQPYAVKVVWEE